MPFGRTEAKKQRMAKTHLLTVIWALVCVGIVASKPCRIAEHVSPLAGSGVENKQLKITARFVDTCEIQTSLDRTCASSLINSGRLGVNLTINIFDLVDLSSPKQSKEISNRPGSETFMTNNIFEDNKWYAVQLAYEIKFNDGERIQKTNDNTSFLFLFEPQQKNLEISFKLFGKEKRRLIWPLDYYEKTEFLFFLTHTFE